MLEVFVVWLLASCMFLLSWGCTVSLRTTQCPAFVVFAPAMLFPHSKAQTVSLEGEQECKLDNPQPDFTKFCNHGSAKEYQYACHCPTSDGQICLEPAARPGTFTAVNTTAASKNKDGTYRTACYFSSSQLHQTLAGIIFCSLGICNAQARAAAQEIVNVTLCNTVPEKPPVQEKFTDKYATNGSVLKPSGTTETPAVRNFTESSKVRLQSIVEQG